jgi:hypothetical protein
MLIDLNVKKMVWLNWGARDSLNTKGNLEVINASHGLSLTQQHPQILIKPSS